MQYVAFGVFVLLSGVLFVGGIMHSHRKEQEALNARFKTKGHDEND